MADVQVNQTGPAPSNGRGSGVIWGVAAGLLVVILVLVFLIFARDRDGVREETQIDVDVPQPSTIEVPRVEVPEVRVPDKVEVDLPEKVEVEVKTPPPQKTSTR